jgi:DNA-binding SARP family transcriptional activator
MVADDGVLVRLLGPLELIGRGGVVPLGAPKRRAVLALLALEVNRVVPVDRMLDLLWDGEPPPRARTALQGHVSALRRMLDPRLPVCTRDPGYVLTGDRDAVDVYRFRALVASAAGEVDDDRAVDTLRSALALWRGPVLAGVPGEYLSVTVPWQLEEGRVEAVMALAERLLRLGRAGEVVGELAGLAQRYPLRENLVRLLMLALHSEGRQSEAFDLYDRTRRQLAEELGADPNPALLAGYETILRGRRCRWRPR